MEIITTHSNTDLDALASMVAAQKLYPGAEMVFPGKLSRNVEEFMSLHKDALIVRKAKEVNLEKIKRIILVDTKSPVRLAKLADVVTRPKVEIHIYDHHPWADGDIRGQFELVETVGATTTLLVEKIRGQGIILTPLEATILALGIYEDTGGLVFTSTTSRDAESVAYLLSSGANLAVVAEFLGRPLTDEQKALLETIYTSAERHLINGVKVLIAKGTVDDYVEGLALLTHLLAEIERVDVVFAIVKMDDRIHIVARSSGAQVNVNKIMLDLGGGGHPAAASATIKGATVDEVLGQLLDSIKRRVRPPITAGWIMSTPVKTVTLDTTIHEASQVMLRYGHSGLPVLKGEQLVGVISRRDVEKATHHGLGHAPVKGYMTGNVITVDPDLPVTEVRELMIKHDIGRLPVVKDGRLMGIVSRTDVLRTLHGDFQNRYRTVYLPSDDFQYHHNIREVLYRRLTRDQMTIIENTGNIAEEMGFQLYAGGGVVRDVLLGVENLDLDLVVEGDGIALAKTLSERLGGQVRAHSKFGTAEVSFPGNVKIDVATARVEFYEYPAALPHVESSTIRADLYRRDFTINAMAVALNPQRFGELLDYFGGQEDLYYGLVRVLHNLSFVEDPIRILRAVRFEQRYRLTIEPQTLKLLQEAVYGKLLLNVSTERIWNEIKLVLKEAEPGKMLSRLVDLQIWPFIFPEVIYWEVHPVVALLPEAIKEMRSWGLLLEGGSWLSYLLALLHWNDQETAREACLRYQLSRRNVEKVLTTLSGWREVLARFYDKDLKVSELAMALLNLPREAYPLILSLLEEPEMRRRFKEVLLAIKGSKPLVNGKDIKKLGYRPGPIFREVLDAVWKARLDGLVKTREGELSLVREYLEKLEGAKAGV